jgi:hypothetical protein
MLYGTYILYSKTIHLEYPIVLFRTGCTQSEREHEQYSTIVHSTKILYDIPARVQASI